MRTFVIPLIATLLLVTACQEEQHSSENMPGAKHETATEHSHEKSEPSESLADAEDDTALEHASKHLDTQYVCPMHPEIVSDEPGSCSICGMFLVEKDKEEVEEEVED